MKNTIYILVVCFHFFSCTKEKQKLEYYKIDQAKMAKTVIITRDNYGIPHIKGPTDESVIFGLAYARAEDHFSLIENAVIRAIGRSSEIYGKDRLRNDYLIKAFKIEELCKKEYDQLDIKVKLLCDAYAEGLNYYLKKNNEIKAKLIEHFEPWHFLAVERNMWGSFGFSQAGFYNDEVTEYIKDNRIEPLVGSNMWAISPSKTKNKNAFLVINPHIASDQPYEVHISSEEGWEFYGLVAYGANIMPVLGHNSNLGWSLTVNYPDIGDAFKVKFDHPTDSLKYRLGSVYLKADVWTDSLKIKTDSGVVVSNYTFIKTIHGPVFKGQDNEFICYKSAGFETGGSIPQFYEMSKSSSMVQFKDAIKRTSIAFHNFMYADKEGNILYVYNGSIPVRSDSIDWTKPVDGNDSSSLWKGYHALNELPQLLNPQIGYLQNCNSDPFFTTSSQNPDSTLYPSYMTNLQPDTKRSERSKNILDSLNEIEMLDLEKAIMDTYVHRAEEELPKLFTEYDSLQNIDLDRANKIANQILILKDWDKYSRLNSIATTIYFIWDELKFSQNPNQNWPNITFLEETIKLLIEEQGSWQIKWGDVMRHQRATNNSIHNVSDSLKHYPLAGGPGRTGIMFTLWPGKIKDGVKRRSKGGHSYVAIVEFGEKVSAKSIIPYGMSRDSSSTHYNDQAELYSNGKFKKVLFTQDEIEANKEEIYRPGERKKMPNKK